MMGREEKSVGAWSRSARRRSLYRVTIRIGRNPAWNQQ